jgi:N-acyl-D-amino-acid deacylase
LGNYTYCLFEKQPEELGEFLQKGDFTGLNVTIPYKKDVIAYCAELSPCAKKMGAVNTIVRRSDGTLIGHSNLRLAVMGFVNRDPNPEEMEQLKALLEREMQRGAFGMSLGLIYPPSAFSKKEELIELAKVIAKYDGILAVHMRNEGPRLFAAVQEMLDIAESSGVHVQISHLKLMGKPQWGKNPLLLEKIEAARARGVQVTCDQYPFPASSTGLSALVPHWAHEGGNEAMVKRLEARDIFA